MNYDMQQELRNVLERFAGQLLNIFRHELIGAFEGGGASAPPTAIRRRAVAKPAAPARPAGVRRGRRPSASTEEVEQIELEIVALLKEHSGKFLTAKDLRTRLSVDEKPFRLALNTLIGRRSVALQGARRSARYGIA